MAIYFTSDLHFDHENAFEFSPEFRSQFKNVDDMNLKIIKLWNDKVKQEDIVFNLGDFVILNKNGKTEEECLERIIYFANQLNGKHCLIVGNHDDLIYRHKDKLMAIKKKDGNKLFEIIEKDFMMNICLNGIDSQDNMLNFVLYHYPTCEWEDSHRGSIHLYGHIHNRMAIIKGKALNVGLDLHYDLLKLEEVIHIIDQLPHYVHYQEEENLKKDYAFLKNKEEKRWAIINNLKKINM